MLKATRSPRTDPYDAHRIAYLMQDQEELNSKVEFWKHLDAKDKANAGKAKRASVPGPKRAVVPAQPVDTVKLAKIDARARYDRVMASDAVEGRRKQAEELLLASCSNNAKHKNSSAIIAELRTRPTDNELEAQAAAGRKAETSAMWSRAHANVARMTGRN